MRLFSNFKKIFLASESSTWQLILLITIMTLTTFIELVSIGSIYPLITATLNSQDSIYFSKNEFFFFLEEFSILTIIVGVILIFVFRFIFLIPSAWYQSFFCERMIVDISFKIFSGYINKDLKSLENQKISDLVRIATGSVNQIVNSYFLQVIIICFEIVTILMIGVTVILILGAYKVLIGVVIATIVALFFRIINNYLIKLGNIKRTTESEKIELVNDSYHLSRELRNFKISNRTVFQKKRTG